MRRVKGTLVLEFRPGMTPRAAPSSPWEHRYPWATLTGSLAISGSGMKFKVASPPHPEMPPAQPSSPPRVWPCDAEAQSNLGSHVSKLMVEPLSPWVPECCTEHSPTTRKGAWDRVRSQCTLLEAAGEAGQSRDERVRGRPSGPAWRRALSQEASTYPGPGDQRRVRGELET